MTPEGGNPPRRVRVTSPRTTAGRQRRVNVTSEIDAQTRLGELYMSTLLRAQLRLAVTVILVVLVVVGGLPLSYLLFPGSTTSGARHAAGLVLLGFAAYPSCCSSAGSTSAPRAQRARLRRHGREVVAA
jgi:hypothetical protein